MCETWKIRDCVIKIDNTIFTVMQTVSSLIRMKKQMANNGWESDETTKEEQ